MIPVKTQLIIAYCLFHLLHCHTYLHRSVKSKIIVYNIFQCRIFVQPVRRPPKSRHVSRTVFFKQCHECRWVLDSRYPSSHHWTDRLHNLLLQTQRFRVTSVHSYKTWLPTLGCVRRWRSHRMQDDGVEAVRQLAA